MTPPEIEADLARRDRPPRLLAVDGLPLSGKSTLAERLATRFGWDVLGFDDFYLPAKGWPAGVTPQFPFPFFRVEAFREAVRSLRTEGRCLWNPIDWPTLTVSPKRTELVVRGTVIVEGCSVLDPALVDLYDLRIFVESDRDTIVEAQRARDGDNALVDDWTHLFLPSVNIYMQTNPRSRADLIVAGRGRVRDS
jgi:uridine kinase